MSNDDPQTAEAAGLRLVLALMRSPHDDGQRADVQALVRAGVDWDVAIAVARHHALVPLVAKAAAAFAPLLPPDVLARLRDERKHAAAAAMFGSAQLTGVVRVLDDIGIEAMAYKGPALAHAAYPDDPGVRPYNDLDLIVRPGEIARAREALRRAGYHDVHALSPRQAERFNATDGDWPMSPDDGGLLVELHARVSSERFVVGPRTHDLFARARRIEIAGSKVITPSLEDHALIICVHGAKHRWARLGWLVDLVSLARARSELDWTVVAGHAEELGAGRLLQLGVLLAARILGYVIDPALLASAENSSAVRRLADDVWRDRNARPLGVPGVAGSLLFNLRALRSTGDRVRYCVRWLFSPGPEDWSYVKLPAPLDPLYVALRPVRLALRYGWPRSRT